jgi:hypothetical protein
VDSRITLITLARSQIEYFLAVQLNSRMDREIERLAREIKELDASAYAEIIDGTLINTGESMDDPSRTP